MKAIYLGSIIQGQFSEWQLFVSNYHWSIILRGNSFSSIVQGLIICRENYRGSNLGGGIRCAIILGVNCPGGNYPGGNCPRGNCLGINSLGAIVRGGGNFPVAESKHFLHKPTLLFMVFFSFIKK